MKQPLITERPRKEYERKWLGMKERHIATLALFGLVHIFLDSSGVCTTCYKTNHPGPGREIMVLRQVAKEHG